ncbi:MAG TPA: aldo/keto reductase [Gammaproteobacteria bacterium]|nr:aldo/keto reductase [Gammaproteobacteria bacterium]
MLYRKLGYTGFDTSLLGFGTWQLGNQRWALPANTDSVRLLQEAHDLGVNVYDVAVVYGQYLDTQGYLQSKSQEILGKAFAKQRDRVIYCLKLGQFDEYSHRHDYNPKRLVEQFQQSLRRLQTDYVDICLIHAPSLQEVKSQKAISVLQTLQALGHIRMIGYSFEAEPEHTLHAIQQQIDVIMLQYNLLDQECASAIEQARLHGVGVLAGGPFKRGYLTGKYRNLGELPAEDDYWQWNLKLNKNKIQQQLLRVNALLDEYGSPENLRHAALQFILNQAGVASCIVGHRSIAEVKENLRFVKELLSIVQPVALQIQETHESKMLMSA